MGMGLAHSTTALLDEVWSRVRARLDGIDDREYLWEPVPGCWSVRARGDLWEVERRHPEPHPAPVTTIAWRTWHIGSECVDGFAQMLFDTGALELGEQEWFPDAASALEAMDAAWVVFRDRCVTLDDDAMARPLGDRFGPFAEHNHADLLLHVADEVIHHGAEMALLRDLYAASGRMIGQHT